MVAKSFDVKLISIMNGDTVVPRIIWLGRMKGAIAHTHDGSLGVCFAQATEFLKRRVDMERCMFTNFLKFGGHLVVDNVVTHKITTGRDNAEANCRNRFIFLDTMVVAKDGSEM